MASNAVRCKWRRQGYAFSACREENKEQPLPPGPRTMPLTQTPGQLKCPPVSAADFSSTHYDADDPAHLQFRATSHRTCLRQRDARRHVVHARKRLLAVCRDHVESCTECRQGHRASADSFISSFGLAPPPSVAMHAHGSDDSAVAQASHNEFLAPESESRRSLVQAPAAKLVWQQRHRLGLQPAAHLAHQGFHQGLFVADGR